MKKTPQGKDGPGRGGERFFPLAQRRAVLWGVALVMAAGIAGPLGAQVAPENLSPAEVQADSASYRIGAEDVLYIHVWKEEALSRSVPVRMDGKISLPLIDEVPAAGLTPLQLKEILIRKFQKYVEVPNVSVTVMECNSFKVFISGQVRAPGVYRLRSETSLLQIIPMAGGFSEWANPKKILIIRKENGREKRITLNYQKIVKGQDPGAASILQPGDTIIVP